MTDRVPIPIDRVPLTVRGRGAQVSPPNRFESARFEADPPESAAGTDDAPSAAIVLPDQSRTIINEVDHTKSPDIPFRWTINPYRGCEHGCTYCYARPTHEYLGFSSGLDFETRIMAKHDAARMLRRELADPRWKPETIVMSGVTDCYQPIERELRITRGCLEVMTECRQPVSIVTKSRLITRDLDLLGELARHGAASAAVSITTLDNVLASRMEPRASAPRERLEAIARLRQAGVPVGVMVAPIIPGLTDREIPAILKAAADAGAQWSGYVMLRLPHQVKDVFLDWLSRHFPDRTARVESAIRQTRGGCLNDPTPGQRMRGEGVLAEQLRQSIKVFSRRYGLRSQLGAGEPPYDPAVFRRPALDGQLSLFEH